MMSDIIARGMSAKNNKEAIKESKNEVAKFFNDTRIDGYSDCNIDGAPIISNPDSLIYINALGINGTSPVIIDTIGTKGGYSPSLGGDSEGLSSEYNDYAYYPNYINRPDPAGGRYGNAKWKLVNGEYPSGILEYTYSHGDITAHTKVFVKSEVAYTVFDVSGINDMRYGTTLKSSENVKNFTGGYEVFDTKPCLIVKDNTSGLWFGLACSNMTQYQVDISPINVTLGLDTAKILITNQPCSIAVGCGVTGGGESHVVFCSSSGMDKMTVVNNVLNGLINWKEKLGDTEDDWANFYGNLGDDLTEFTAEQKSKYYMCLHQIRSQTYNGYMTAGMPNWYKNFIRDTAWAIYSLCKTKHDKSIELATAMADWWNGIDSFVHANSFTIDKKRCETSMNQTDSACTFLMAIGELYKVNGYDATGIKSTLDECMRYVQEHLVEADGHIIALHAHDFWDDYTGDIDVGLVKYESMVDVLWILGLEAIAPVYTKLNDLVMAQYCTDVATLLRNNLEDYRNLDGGLYYAIKNDATLYTTVETLPSTLYAGWLLNDELCKNWVLNYGEKLRIKGGLTTYPLAHSNALNNPLFVGAWMPYAPIVALLASESGDNSLVDELSNCFSFGGFPEYGKVSNADKFVWNSHALTFPWAEAMYIVMINALNN